LIPSGHNSLKGTGQQAFTNSSCSHFGWSPVGLACQPALYRKTTGINSSGLDVNSLPGGFGNALSPSVADSATGHK